MGIGILACGLNGAGKSTLGKNPAKKLGFSFIDAEDLHFPKTESGLPYAHPRSCREARALFLKAAASCENLVLASVKDSFLQELSSWSRYIVLIGAPKALRLRRLKARSLQKFGGRARPGGDLYEQETAFLSMAAAREEREISQWARTLGLPVLRVDGTRSAEENACRAAAWIRGQEEAARWRRQVPNRPMANG